MADIHNMEFYLVDNHQLIEQSKLEKMKMSATEDQTTKQENNYKERCIAQ